MDERWEELYGGICANIVESEENIQKWTEWLNKITPTEYSIPFEELNQKLYHFQRLLLVFALSPKWLTTYALEYVKNTLREVYTQSSPVHLSKAYKDSSSSTPIIFILSTGADPSQNVMRFEEKEGFGKERLEIPSLGQGEGWIAAKMLKDRTENGSLIFLHYYHLSVWWMNGLRRISLSCHVHKT